MDAPSVDKHITAMLNAEVIGVDTEGTGIGAPIVDGRAYGMGISVAYRFGDMGLMSAYFPFRHEDGNLDKADLYKLKNVIESKPVTFHNAKHDIHTLRTFGIEPKNFYDTMVIAHMINEEWPSKELDWLSKVLLHDSKQYGDRVKMWGETFGWSTIPVGIMSPYAEHDAELHLLLLEHLWPQMKEQELDSLWSVERDFIYLLSQIERTGIKARADFCREKAEYGLGRMDACANELGFVPTPTNLASFLLDELGLPVVKRSAKTGKPSFDKKAMEIYDEMLSTMDRTEAKLILEYRGWQKAVSSFWAIIPEVISPDGRVRTEFKPHGTVTGRLSSKKPNLQQIPRAGTKPWNGDAKLAFEAEPGYKLIEFDYSQLEYRLATAYGQDAELVRIFNNDEDPFLPLAERVFGGVEQRQNAKTYTYLTLYGGGIRRAMAALGVDEQTAISVREGYRELYPGIFRASDQAGRLAKSRGYVRYWTGRRRHFANDEGSHKAFNSVIQGGGAELVKRSLLRVAEELPPDKARIVLTVHDSGVLEIREDAVEDLVPRVIKLMTDWPEFGVKLSVDAHEWGH